MKVLDFGLVRQYLEAEPVEAGGDHENVVEGTPWFTPPEAINGSLPIDPRSDIYSLGALGYFLLTGRYIFDAATIQEIHEKQLSMAPIPPRQRTTQPISREMEQLLSQCLEKDPNSRPQSAKALRDGLLACPPAGDWSVVTRTKWWESHDRHPSFRPGQTLPETSTPMATVRIDLASRMD